MLNIITTNTAYFCVALFFFSIQTLAESQNTEYGYLEPIYLADGQLELHAKLDTGAKTASLYATNIKIYTHGKQKWVRFTITKTKTSSAISIQRPLLKLSKIKMRALSKGHADIRPVVSMTICLGNKLKKVSVNLANREGFNYPLLLGRDAIIEFNGIINPAKSFTKKPCSVHVAY